MKGITVLHVLEAVGGGTSRHLLDVITHAQGVSHEVVIPRRRFGWLSDDNFAESLVRAGASVHVIEMRRRPYSVRNAVGLWRLYDLIRLRRPDVVHGHSSIGGALGRLGASMCGTSRIYTPNGITPSRSVLGAERRLARLTDYFVAVSASEGAMALRAGLAKPAQLRVIANGIDLTSGPPAIPLRDILNISPDIPLVGTLARLDPQKDPLTFVKICALVARHCHDAQFVLIGDGRVRQQVLAEAQALIASNKFHYLPGLANARGALGAMSVFVSTSRYEGGPYTPLDAMQTGVPLVLSDCVGNCDVAENDAAALTYPPGDASAGADAVLRLLSDAQLRSRMIAAARARLRAQYDVRSMASSLEHLYREAVSR